MINLKSLLIEKITDTPEFKRWFGNSKAVDGNGNPIILYHGTETIDGFTIFDLKKSKGIYGKSISTSPSPETARQFSGKFGTIYPVYVKIENPVPGNVERALVHYWERSLPVPQKMLDLIEKNKWDGVIATNNDWSDGEVAVFHPEQIKSAIGNIGNFDPNDPDITKENSLLTEKIIDTPEFKRWFGNSKVVDKNGIPLKVFHGTGHKDPIISFKIGSGMSAHGIGIYFTHDLSKAHSYTPSYVNGHRSGKGGIYPVFLKIEKPAGVEELQNLSGEYRTYNQFSTRDEADRISKELQKRGYDGIIVRNEYIVFHPNQVKSAIGNKGTFDPNDPDITKENSLSELEYPLAKGEDVQSYGGMAGWKGKIVWMTPDKFLRLVYPLPRHEESDESAKNLEDRMKKGLPIDFLVLVIDTKKKKVIGHEGRHRATVAKRLGIEKVPVLIYTGETFKRVPQWDPEDHAMADKAEFKPEWDKSLSEAKLDIKSEGDISPEDKKKAAQLLYKYFEERETLPWMFSHSWKLESVKTGWSWIDGERYEFEYIPKKGKEIQTKPYPELDYKRPVKVFRNPNDAVDYTIANNMEKYGANLVFRGMNMAEWVDARKKGYVQSKGSYNFSNQKGYTYFGKDWATAHSYAAGFAPFDKEPTRSLPGVIIAVPKELTRNAKDVLGQQTDNEYIAEKIPLEQIKGVWYIVPIQVGRGKFELVLKDGRLDRGSASPPSTRLIIVPKAGIAL